MTSAPRPELSRPLQLEGLAPGGTKRVMEADPAERAAVARRLDLLDLASLRAELTVTSRGRGQNARLTVKGTLHAEVTQACVVTLEPVPALVDTTVDRLFAAGAPPSPEAETDLDQPDLEPLPETSLDLGEIVVEDFPWRWSRILACRMPKRVSRRRWTAKGIGLGEEPPTGSGAS